VYKISDDYIERRNAKRENKKKKLIEVEVSDLVDRIPSTNEYIKCEADVVVVEEPSDELKSLFPVLGNLSRRQLELLWLKGIRKFPDDQFTTVDADRQYCLIECL